MKKFFISTFFVICLFLNLQIFSYQLTVGDDNAIDIAVEIFKEKIIKNDEETKDFVVTALNQIITKYDSSERNYEIIRVLMERIDNLTMISDKGLMINEEKNLNEKQDYLCEDIYAPVCAETTNSGALTFGNRCEAEKYPNFKALLFEGECEEENDLSGINTLEEYTDKIDISKVKKTWLEWQNDVRTSLGLTEYEYSNKLDFAAQEWSEVLLSRGDLDVETVHKRDLGDSYYDYNKIFSWLKDRGVVCKNIDRATFSESVAWTSYYCSEEDEDCTAKFIDGLRVSFDRYLSEKDRTENSRPHYNAIISPYFTTIGMGIAVNKKSENYFEVFITTHYCSGLE